MQNVRVESHHLRARAALATAERSRDAGLLRRAAKEARIVAKEKVGWARALARLVLGRRGFKDSRNVRGLRISAAELGALSDELSVSTHGGRVAMPAVPARRADLLPTGALIFSTMMSELGLSELTICDWGLREGVILDWLRDCDEKL